MKIRYGFVSNSSSSSFLVLVKKSEFAKNYMLRMVGFEMFLDYAESADHSYETDIILKGDISDLREYNNKKVEELNKYLSEQYKPSDYMSKMYNEEIESINSDFNKIESVGNLNEYLIYSFRISYHDEILRSFMEMLLIEGNDDIIFIVKDF